MATCTNCNTNFEGKYCYNCGQKRYTAKDKSVKHLLEEALHFITHFEGTFFKTLKAVSMHPGQLTTDFGLGRRKPYFKPVSFYLLIVVVYLLFPVAEGLSMHMENYKTMRVFGQLITQQIENKAIAKNLTEAQLAEIFKEKSHGTSKILLFLFIPFSAAVISLLYFRVKKVWYDKLILSTEINIFYLLVFYLLIPLLYFTLAELHIISLIDDEVVGLFSTFIFGLYSAVLFRRIFHSSVAVSLLKGLIFAFIHSFLIVLLYKFLVFEATILRV